jgi:hypothetical protein
MKFEFSRHACEKHSDIKFHEIPSSGSPDVPCGRTDGQIGITKLTVAFRNFANAPKQRGQIELKKQCFFMGSKMLDLEKIVADYRSI